MFLRSDSEDLFITPYFNLDNFFFLLELILRLNKNINPNFFCGFIAVYSSQYYIFPLIFDNIGKIQKVE